jgi:DNA-binding HxlR family transcriptional regulator
VAKRGAVRREHEHDSGGDRPAGVRGSDRRGPAPVREDGDVPAASRSSPVALDRIIHERVRLAIVSALAGNDSLSFNELKELLGTTDGNLSVHARRLEEAGYIACAKTFAGRVPRTDYRITAAGRRALHAYLDHMEALIKRVRDV